MSLLECLGQIKVPKVVSDHADLIKYENYKTNTPASFHKHTQDDQSINCQLSELTGLQPEKIDWVYFSVCKGAEPHTDLLDPNKFGKDTYVVPVILPSGKSTIYVEGQSTEVELNKVYKFDHGKVHGMDLEDCDSGCVLIMAAELIAA